MNYSLLEEISRELPPDITAKYKDAALFIAYGCALLEHETGSGYTYKVVNLKTARSALLCRKTNPLTTSGVEKMVRRMRESYIAGAGRYEVDMKPGDVMSRSELTKIQTHIFQKILPEYGYGIREKQVELAAHILHAISRRAVSLSEAEVGTGKTHAYLMAAVLAKRGRMNDFWMRGHYPDQSYAQSAYMPIVISTSSIALQRAIVRDYIPEISRILMAHGVIKTPLSCVLRKGKEHYVCERNLRTYYANADAGTKSVLKPLLEAGGPLDLAEADGLTPYVKRRIGVSGRCGEDCPYFIGCRYLRHMKRAQSSEYDFQVCNHNYFLADVLRNKAGQSPLIPHYQAVIIDEGHKFLQAARQMYGVELGSKAIRQITDDIRGFTFCKGESSAAAVELAVKLAGANERLFKLLYTNIVSADEDDETERYKTVMDNTASRLLLTIKRLIDELTAALPKKRVLKKYEARCSQAIWELSRIKEQAAVLEKHGSLVYWLEKPDEEETRLCAIPKKLNEMLYADLWKNGVPVILTSGTLSAAGSFEHIKRNMGLDRLSPRLLMETSKPSPFNHRKNALIYISETVPFPDIKDRAYIMAAADETERLIRAAHGHAAVLFTSYKAMDMVYKLLEGRKAPFPMLRLDRGGVSAIERFRESGNGVLFASGALWEGIDLPGDILSLLVIVKLPFAVPDPIGEYEQTLYKDMSEYKNSVVVPEMIIKLKQGFGRLIRSETDTGVVALLDSRVRKGAAYRDRVLAALPDCAVTSGIGDVNAFMRSKKEPDYFA